MMCNFIHTRKNHFVNNHEHFKKQLFPLLVFKKKKKETKNLLSYILTLLFENYHINHLLRKCEEKQNSEFQNIVRRFNVKVEESVRKNGR